MCNEMEMFGAIFLTLFLVFNTLHLTHSSGNSGTIDIQKLPVLPTAETLQRARAEFAKRDTSRCKRGRMSSRIPCHLWITAREWSFFSTPYHVKALALRNSAWHTHLISDKEINVFMNDVFGGTKLLWAFNLINPRLGAAKADVWRIAILWVYGGVYIDADADILTPLSHMIRTNDSFLFGTEKNRVFDCYKENFHLNQSITQTFAPFWNDQIFLQWLLASEPGHPFLARTLENIVEMITLEYSHQSAIACPLTNEFGFHGVICATGPMVFSASVLEVINKDATVPYRYVGTDFSTYNGRFRAQKWDKKKHYITLMSNSKVLLLNEYAAT